MAQKASRRSLRHRLPHPHARRGAARDLHQPQRHHGLRQEEGAAERERCGSSSIRKRRSPTWTSAASTCTSSSPARCTCRPGGRTRRPRCKLTRRMNDIIAGWVRRYPKRFVGTVTLPMQDVALSIERAQARHQRARPQGRDAADQCRRRLSRRPQVLAAVGGDPRARHAGVHPSRGHPRSLVSTSSRSGIRSASRSRRPRSRPR